MSPRELLIQRAGQYGYWFHSFEVLPGVWTNGAKSRAVIEMETANWGFPDDLTGRHVLDIGCADGAFSAEALRRGAASVLGIDDQMTVGMRMIVEAEALPGFTFRQVDLFSEAFMALPTFDFILCAGVLYHVHDMLEALKRIRTKAAGEVLLETIWDHRAGATPPLALFYEGAELNNDPTNWWSPNLACLEGMLRTAGFGFEKTFTFTAQGEEESHGRIAYRLQPADGSVFAAVTRGATGTHSPLEEARQRVRDLEAEVARLRAEAAGR